MSGVGGDEVVARQRCSSKIGLDKLQDERIIYELLWRHAKGQHLCSSHLMGAPAFNTEDQANYSLKFMHP